jgi:hypothetical protein
MPGFLRACRTALALGLLAASGAHANGPPRFDQYPAASAFHGKSAAPVLNTKFARRYRTRLREAAASGPNFAGSFIVAEWGCGAGCVQLAVIDARSGAVHRGPFAILEFGSLPANAEPLSYRLDRKEPLAKE